MNFKAGRFFGVVFFMALFFSCSTPPVEIMETIYSAEENALAESEFGSTIDVVLDVLSTDERLRKRGGTLLPPGAEIKFIDSSFLDGNGVELTIDFGPTGNLIPYGTLCSDKKYRSGKIRITADRPFNIFGCKIQIKITQSDSFFTGNGSEMVQPVAVCDITILGPNKISVEIHHSQIIYKTGKSTTWTASRIIEVIEDRGPGLWMDKLSITGTGSGINHTGEKFTTVINSPLIKLINEECAKNFSEGKYTVRNESGEKTIFVDFDPTGEKLCDELAEAKINGKKIIFKIR